LGLGDDDVVALLMRNDIALFEASLAIGIVGAYATPINWHASREEADYVIADSEAKALIAHADLLSGLGDGFAPHLPIFTVETPIEIARAYRVEDSARQVRRGTDWQTFVDASTPYDKPARPSRGAMIYTSGTTGRSKGVRRSPLDTAGVALMQRTTVEGFGLGTERQMTVLMNGPMYHSAPNSYAQAALMLGANIVLQPRFDAEELLALIERHRVTHMHIVPTMFHRLLKLPDDVRKRYDTSSLIDVVHGAAPCPVATKRAMIDWWGPIISEYYGSTETGLVTRLTSAEALEHPKSVGKALPGVEIITVDHNRRLLPPGEIGDIYLKTPHMPPFTYHNAATKRSEVELDGFVTIGDIGRVNPDGFVYLLDRRNDMIISGGVNIYPAEIEAAILAQPGIRDCAVFGAPHDEFGECVVAHVECDEGRKMTAADLREGLSGSVARFKLPTIIEFAESLPREDSGKIFKRKLREQYWVNTGRKI
jgi:long-chain acyl-CoA synthetase